MMRGAGGQPGTGRLWAMGDVLVDQPGAFVGKHSERLRVTVRGTVVAEHPLLDVGRVLLAGQGLAISADAVRACAERGIRVDFLSGRGEPYASLFSPVPNATAATRRAQLAAPDNGRAATLVAAIAAAKMTNQANVLKYAVKNWRVARPDLFEDVRALADEVERARALLPPLHGRPIEAVRAALGAAEARASRAYWSGFGRLLRRVDWPGRQHQDAADLANGLLNYGYGVLYGEVERAAVAAGLDPFAGFLHADRPGSPSLVFDLIEQFRQPAVDRVVLGLVNRGTRLALDADGRLDAPTRRRTAEAVLARLDDVVAWEGQRQPLRLVIRHQAERAATFLRGERGDYRGFAASW
jgi:CRISPR-associated protein Cas1